MTQKTRPERPTYQQVDDMLDPIRTMVQTATSVQSEFLTLWTRRAAAYLDLPRQVSTCRSPNDLVEEQITFLNTMQRNYAEYAEAVLRIAMPAIEQGGRDSADDGGAQKAQPKREHRPQEAA
jgi:hypothetical protein